MSMFMSMMRMRPRAFRAALPVFIIIILVAAPTIEAQQVQNASYRTDGMAVPTGPSNTIDLLVGRSTILNVGAAIARLSLTVPDIADALVTAPQQILIHGKTPGTISLFVWEKTGAIRTYEVTVRRDLSVLANQLRQLFPGEPVVVTGSGKDVVLSGRVSTPYVVDKAAEVAVAYAEKKENVVNLLKLQEGVASNQVMLKVRFAEVSRSAVQELGASWFTGPGGYRDYVARLTTQQFAAPNYEELVRSSIQGVDNWGGGRGEVDATGGKMTFNDFLNFFLFNNRYNVGTLIRAMSSKGLFQSLAEPNLVATDGKEASFLAGGEYPYPVVQGSAQGGASVSIQFKEFGIKLNFTPTILGGDLIHLKLRPEVSSLDFNNAVIIEGFRIPALSTRRTETEIELRDGQTFAIAGLLNNTVVSSMRKVPGIGDIPILGLLFKSRAYQKDATELVVMITPHILKRGSTGVSDALPNAVEPYLGAPDKSIPQPMPYSGSPRWGATQQGPEASVQPPVTQQPQVQPQRATERQPGGNTPAPQRSAEPVVQAPAPQPGQAAEPKLSKSDLKRIEEARRREQEQRELEAKRQAEAQRAAAKAAEEERQRQEADARVALKKAEEDKKKLEEAAREQAKRDAAAAKKAADEKRKAEEQQKKLAAEEAKRQKALAEAEAKVKEAQSAYEAVVRTAPNARPIP